MKLKVIKNFTDKYTGESYKIGDVITVEDKRGDEILSSAAEVAEAIEDDKPAEKSTTKKSKK